MSSGAKRASLPSAPDTATEQYGHDAWPYRKGIV